MTETDPPGTVSRLLGAPGGGRADRRVKSQAPHTPGKQKAFPEEGPGQAWYSSEQGESPCWGLSGISRLRAGALGC